MIEKDIERAVIKAVAALRMDGLDIGGFWQPAPDGAVKSQETPEASAFLRVAAGTRSFETFSTPRADIPVALSLSVRIETAPTGEALAAYTEPLMALLQGWQMSIETVKNDFAVQGFAPCGFRLDGGEVGTVGEPRRVWTVTQKFTLRGVVTKGTNT